MTKYPEGSLWNKWDLHIHTPTSLVQNFGGDLDQVWGNYIDTLESLPKEVKVLGINDYFFIDGYERVLEEKHKGRLRNIDLILPVIEFRLRDFAGTKLKLINFHVIFSDCVSVNDIRRKFLAKLSFDLDGMDQTILNKADVERLGKNLLSPHSNEKPIKLGFRAMAYSLDHLTDTLKKNFQNSEYLTVLGHAEWSSFTQEEAGAFRKANLIRKVDLVWSASDDDYQRKRDKLDGWGNSKLLHCSDAHNFKTIGKCNTWIKATPTFEGLRQVLWSFDDRVRVQEVSPSADKSSHNIIRKIQFVGNEADNLFLEDPITLNPGLNVIIGGKSSGKSFLLHKLASSINLDEVEKRARNKQEGKYKGDKLGGVTLNVTWADGTLNYELESQTDKRDSPPKPILFIPQLYLADVVDGKDNNLNEFNELLHSLLDETKGYIELKEKFEENIRGKNQKISTTISEYFSSEEKIAQVRDNLKALGRPEDLEKEEEGLKEKKDKLLRLSTISPEEKELLKSLTEKIGASEQKGEAHNQLKHELDLLLRIEVADVRQNSSVEPYSSAAGLNEIIETIEEIKEKAIKEIENLLKKEIEQANKNAEHEKQVFKSLTEQLQPIKEKLQYESQIDELDEQLKQVREKVLQISARREKLDEALQKKHNLILTLKAVVRELGDEWNSYSNEVSTFLEGMSLQGISMEPVLGFNSKAFVDNINHKLDLRSSSFEGYLQSDKGQQLGLPSDFLQVSTEVYFNKIEALFDLFEAKDAEKKLAYRQGSSFKNLIRDLFDVTHQIQFKVSDSGDDITTMSPGKQALVLLKLIFNLSNSKAPVLIDQPEDNLDNRTIFNDLVKFIKESKQKRQIIIVTHNPNLVVATDAELIVVANRENPEDPKNRGRNHQGVEFEYCTGPLEDSFRKPNSEFILDSMGIREHVCEILEGGADAFKMREQKYGDTLFVEQ